MLSARHFLAMMTLIPFLMPPCIASWPVCARSFRTATSIHSLRTYKESKTKHAPHPP